jgi:hypothetical protein
VLNAPVPIIGRERELDRVAQFVDHLTDGHASLVFEGLAGIGKTAIWSDAIDAAPPHAQLGHLLAPDADRHDHRILHFLAGKRLAGQSRPQSTHVSPHRLGCHQPGSVQANVGHLWSPESPGQRP